MRLRPSVSPPGAGSLTSCSRPSLLSDGMRPFESAEGRAGSARGAGSSSRRGAFSQAL